MTGSYESHKSGNGQFNFVLKAENDQVIVKDNGPTSTIEDKT